MTEKNTPEKKFSAGAVSATIWSNKGEKDGKEFFYKTVTIQRRYQDSDKNWKSTDSHRLNDLPKVALVAKKAYEYMVTKESD